MFIEEIFVPTKELNENNFIVVGDLTKIKSKQK